MFVSLLVIAVLAQPGPTPSQFNFLSMPEIRKTSDELGEIREKIERIQARLDSIKEGPAVGWPDTVPVPSVPSAPPVTFPAKRTVSAWHYLSTEPGVMAYGRLESDGYVYDIVERRSLAPPPPTYYFRYQTRQVRNCPPGTVCPR